MLILLYVRAEREGEFALHLYVCRKMMPNFFAAGHVNYARYGLCYLRSMERLSGNVLQKFMAGEHVLRHQAGIFNGIWSDMAIETTYMKVGKGPSGMIGMTTNDRSVSIWANSHHFCGELLTELEHQRTRGQESPDMKHKEEGKGRINSDSEDRLKIRTAIDKCIHPLDIDSHASSEILVNIYTGEESESSTNVHNALTIGKEQMTLFEKGLPESFRATLTSKVVLMSSVTDKKKRSPKILHTTLISYFHVFFFCLEQIKSNLTISLITN